MSLIYHIKEKDDIIRRKEGRKEGREREHTKSNIHLM
jgi:hypothetical protein